MVLSPHSSGRVAACLLRSAPRRRWGSRRSHACPHCEAVACTGFQAGLAAGRPAVGGRPRLAVPCQHEGVVTPIEGMEQLLAAAGRGVLDELLAEHGVRVLTVLGSNSRDEPDPADLDVGVLFEPGIDGDVLRLQTDLSGTEVDLGVVGGAAAVFRERALGEATPVWESTPGAWIENASVAATLERMDTAWLRRADLERRAHA